MRRLLKAAASRALAWTGCDRLFGAIAGHRGAPLIVGYHRVVEDFAAMRRTSIPAMLTTRRTFERQVDWIARRFHVATLDEIGARLEAGEPFHRRTAAITFDDGYADFYHHAFPILRRKGLPAAVFVVTDLIGRREMQTFDRLYLLLLRALECPAGVDWLCDAARPHVMLAENRKRLTRLTRDPVRMAQRLLDALPQQALASVLEALESRFPIPHDCPEPHRALDWSMLDKMRDAGITIGSHTRTHPLLTLEGPSRVIREVDGSRRLLEEWLDTPIDHFAYPDGRFDAGVVAAVKSAGYRFGYGVCGHRDLAEPLLTIPRRMLWENSCLDGSGAFSPPVMSCHANGVFDLFERCSTRHESPRAADRTMGSGREARSAQETRSC